MVCVQVLELSRQQEVTKQAEAKKKEEEFRLQAAAYKVVGGGAGSCAQSGGWQSAR